MTTCEGYESKFIEVVPTTYPKAYPVVFVLHTYRVQYARNMALKKDKALRS